MIRRELNDEQVNTMFGERDPARRAECEAAGGHDLSRWVPHPFLKEMVGRLCHRCDHREFRVEEGVT